MARPAVTAPASGYNPQVLGNWVLPNGDRYSEIGRQVTPEGETIIHVVPTEGLNYTPEVRQSRFEVHPE